jgi:predicted acetyltransferase
MDLSLKIIESKDRHILENLFRYYVYELSGSTQLDPNAKGEFTFNTSALDLYWQRDDHIPYFIVVDSALAGFVLLRRYPANKTVYDVDQFFILKKYQGKGIGKQVLQQLVMLYKGAWQIRVLLENTAALYFWKAAVANVVGTVFALSTDIDIDLQMHFIRFEAM